MPCSRLGEWKTLGQNTETYAGPNLKPRKVWIYCIEQKKRNILEVGGGDRGSNKIRLWYTVVFFLFSFDRITGLQRHWGILAMECNRSERALQLHIGDNGRQFYAKKLRNRQWHLHREFVCLFKARSVHADGTLRVWVTKGSFILFLKGSFVLRFRDKTVWLSRLRGFQGDDFMCWEKIKNHILNLGFSKRQKNKRVGSCKRGRRSKGQGEVRRENSLGGYNQSTLYMFIQISQCIIL